MQPLREFEILLIICAIIFLALLLLGIGCSYYCLKKRNVKVVRRRPPSTLGSDITKVSEPVSTFVGLKLPRVVAVDASGSEEATESIKTAFPSDTASLESEEEYTSAYSDKTCILPEGAVAIGRQAPPRPGFDIDLLVKQGDKLLYTPAMSSASSESEMVLNAQEQYLTTILERTETNTLETLERIRKAKAKTGPPPVHARLNIKNKQMSDASGTDIDSVSESGTELFSEQEMELEATHMKNAFLAERTRGRQQDMDNIVQVHAVDERILDDRRHLEESMTSTFTREEHHHEEYNEMGMDEMHHDRIRPVIQQRGGGSGAGAMMATVGGHNQMLNNFDVLIRIVTNNSDLVSEAANDDASSVFTQEERTVIRRV